MLDFAQKNFIFPCVRDPFNFVSKYFGKKFTTLQYKSVLPCIRDPLFLKQIFLAKKGLLYMGKMVKLTNNRMSDHR